jgi:hypothetical protein
VGHAWGIKYGKESGLSNFRSHFVCNTDLNGDMTEFVFLFEDGSLSTEYDEDAEGVLLSGFGDGTFRVVSQDEHDHFSWLTLYLMGLVGPEEVPPVHILEGLELDSLGRVTADSVTTVTIDELMAAEGGGC